MTWETEDQLHDLGQATATLNLSFHAHSKGLIKPGAWCLLLRSHCSCAQLWTAARQASLSMGVSRQEYWSGKLFPPPGDLPNAPSCGLQPARLFCPWASPGKSTGVGSCSLLQEIFPTQGSNPGLLPRRQILHRWATGAAQRLVGVRSNPISPLHCGCAGVGHVLYFSASLVIRPGDCVLTPSRAVSESGLETSAVPLLCSLPSPGVGT